MYPQSVIGIGSILETVSEHSGSLLTLVIWTLIFAAGALKCRRVGARPEVNRKSLDALMLLLLAAIVGGVTRTANGILSSGTLLTVIVAGGGIIYCGLLVGTITLATLGRREMSAEPDRYTNGDDQGVYACVFALMALILCVTQVVLAQ